MITPSELTFAAAKASSLANIAGVCTNGNAFVQLLNEAVSRLMTYGNFWNTVVKGRICTQNNCIAWPRQIGTVLGINVGNYTRPINNSWYDFMPLSAGDCYGNSRAWTAATMLVDDGVVPVFQNVPCGTPMYIRAYTRYQADIGKTLTLYGIDQYGQEVMTRDSGTGIWSQGEVLTLVSGYVQSNIKYREITRISKELTTGVVDVYMYDSDTDTLREMAHYEASETEPRYRHTTLKGSYCTSLTGCCGTSTTRKPMVTFLAKLKHIPVVLDSDIVQIDCIPALKLQMQSIRLEENGDDDSANKKQAMAIKEMNRQLADKLPLSQIPVWLKPEGTAEPALAGIGQLI